MAAQRGPQVGEEAIELEHFILNCPEYGYGSVGPKSDPHLVPATARAEALHHSSQVRRLDHIRHAEFSRLGCCSKSGTNGTGDAHNQEPTAYLDHAGSALYSERQLDAAFQELRGVLLSNPHR